MIPAVALSSGEPAGVGPDVVLGALDAPRAEHLVVIADGDLLEERARSLGLPPPRLEDYRPRNVRAAPEPRNWLLHVPARAPVVPGRLERRNAAYVLEILEAACRGLEEGRFSALVTAPVHKGILNEAGHAFSGHTEYLARRFGVSCPVMLFVDGDWRVALLTTHLPLAEVPKTVTAERLEETLRVLRQGLADFYGVRAPRVGVLGLNPHAGEDGVLGQEEQAVIRPVLERLREAYGWDLGGPLPADTAFLADVAARYDALLGMYHDQVLPVVKHRGFASAVNVTLGLPFPRTSVDHGTALEKAGRGTARAENLLAALDHAGRILSRLSRPVAPLADAP